MVDLLKRAKSDLDFFFHVEKRYKEVGKESVDFDKCAEIRSAHEHVTEAIARLTSKLERMEKSQPADAELSACWDLIENWEESYYATTRAMQEHQARYDKALKLRENRQALTDEVKG